MRNSFIDVVLDACRQEDDIFVISGDAGLGVFDDFCKERPDRFINLGVAEQNTISWAAGLAMTGFRVFVYNIVPFVLYRCFEQVRNGICYQDLPVTLVGTGSGVTYAPMGMTHYSVEDLGVAQTLPNLSVLSPADPWQAKAAARYALNTRTPLYVRLAKRGEAPLHDSEPDITQPILHYPGRDVLLVYHGSIAPEVMAAREQLLAAGIDAGVVGVPMISPLPTDGLAALFASARHVVSVEEHFLGSGLGARLARWKGETGQSWPLTCLGIADAYIHEIKKQDGMREHFGISAQAIAQTVRNKIRG